MDDASRDAPGGELVLEEFDYDGGRRAVVSVPPGRPEAIVYAGDGQLIAPWGARIASSGLPPVMVVGAYRTDDDDEMSRIREYSPSFEPARFAAHEDFFVRAIRERVRKRFGVALPRERTAVCGVSASGELALALGLRHPEVYGTVFCASPGGGFRPPAELSAPLPRAYLVAGREEPFFLANARRWARALESAGAEVVFAERAGGHGDAFWAEEFPEMVRWLFRPDDASGSAPT
jgi:enterochelin esterase-like enzyme